MTTAPGWYDDGSGRMRWWDGVGWTEYVDEPSTAIVVAAQTTYGTYTAGPQQVPLDQPLYGATFGDAVSRFWSKYATFDGRASLSEYWWAFLFYVLLAWVPLLNLALIIPMIALTVRRLHDTNRSGAYYFLGFIPFAGFIIMIVLLTEAPVPAGARFDAAVRYGYRPPQA